MITALTFLQGHTKKVTVNSFTLFTFGVGSVVGTYIFLPAQAPAYIPGKAAIVALTILLMLLCVVMWWLNVRLNKQKLAAQQKLIEENGWSPVEVEKQKEQAAFLDSTDLNNVWFMYTK
jgi:ACS family allantoate permease-like MFS transporter